MTEYVPLPENINNFKFRITIDNSQDTMYALYSTNVLEEIPPEYLQTLQYKHGIEGIHFEFGKLEFLINLEIEQSKELVEYLGDIIQDLENNGITPKELEELPKERNGLTRFVIVSLILVVCVLLEILLFESQLGPLARGVETVLISTYSYILAFLIPLLLIIFATVLGSKLKDTTKIELPFYIGCVIIVYALVTPIMTYLQTRYLFNTNIPLSGEGIRMLVEWIQLAGYQNVYIINTASYIVNVAVLTIMFFKIKKQK